MAAVIRMADPIPESDKIRYESHCHECGTHEGLFDTFDHPRLLELLNRHNQSLHSEPGADQIVRFGSYDAAVRQIAELHRLHARQVQHAARQIREYQKDRDLIAEAKQKCDDEVSRLLGVLDAVDEMWGDPDEARRILRKALAKAGLR